MRLHTQVTCSPIEIRHWDQGVPGDEKLFQIRGWLSSTRRYGVATVSITHKCRDGDSAANVAHTRSASKLARPSRFWDFRDHVRTQRYRSLLQARLPHWISHAPNSPVDESQPFFRYCCPFSHFADGPDKVPTLPYYYFGRKTKDTRGLRSTSRSVTVDLSNISGR